MIISLCGFMGAGKSTIGRYLAKTLGYSFIDLDIYIEQKVSMSVAEFFAANGEAAFRKEELESLSEIIDRYSANADKDGFLSGRKGLILSLGGGTVTNAVCAQLVKEHTRCIYLFCSKEELANRLKRNIAKRPVLQGKTDKELELHIEKLMQQREAIYKSCSHIKISTESCNIKEVINSIMENI